MTAIVILALMAFTVGVFIAALVTAFRNLFRSFNVKDEDLEWDSMTQTWQPIK